ncbi:ABC transporter ATP-binding protein [Echinicola strongylocentroti]|uniref:ABC transporter ATP-binding protein n=1 Tax=Echinicola strongylocentroti TaxID=1795355 RepID=A0A2Z4IFD9_9BACT|nr:ABC transporter ATP-binding protein [Echinicola strongylocentroti]AWW29802.1 ABC transporter ATP-binding protein [Echinicola strongylocentroti]
MDVPQYILEGKGVSIGYHKGKQAVKVGESLSFQLSKGKLNCLLGPNGVGKSTLVKTIMGHLPSMAGEIIFSGIPLHEQHPRQLAQKISVVLTDKITAGNLTVTQLVALGRTPFTNWLGKLSAEDKRIISEAMRATKIYYLKDQLISEISDGQLQKVMIARALAQDGQLIILDEPTAHLDLINRYEIMHLLRDITQQQGKSILVVTHDLEIAIETADHLWIMQCGEPLTTGTPEDLIISGKINLLTTGSGLTFDPTLGKIRPAASQDHTNIHGPDHLVQWLKLALQKSGTSLPEGSSIEASDGPPTFSVKSQGSEEKFHDILSVVSWLNQH